jgi:hypothetical protein
MRVLIAWLGVALLGWASRAQRAFQGVLIAAFGLGGGYALQMLPWQNIGLGVVGSLNLARISYAMLLIGPMLFASGAAAAALAGQARLARFATAFLFAVAAGQFVWVKAYNMSTWLSQGGLANIEQRLASLKDGAWLSEPLARSVAIPYRLPSNLLIAAGLETYDGAINLNLTSVAKFWKSAVLRGQGDVTSGYTTLETADFDPKCCAQYDFDAFFDADSLRMLNVGYVLSVLPLTGSGLRQVSGPADMSAPPRSTEPLFERLRGYAGAIVNPPPVRVYALASPLPRLFAAQGIAFSNSDDAGAIRSLALQRVAVLDPDIAKHGYRTSPDLVIDNVRLVRDGVEAALQAPSEGLALLNIPFTPFWSASADGVPVALLPANGGVHMAIRIPAGARNLSITYRRPTLLSRLPFFKES